VLVSEQVSEQISNQTSQQTWVVEVTLPPAQQIRFQAILQGEEGLAVVRCFDPEKKKQQLWVPVAQQEEFDDWLNSLPKTLELKVLRQWLWGEVRS